jgi:hypothetical protein
MSELAIMSGRVRFVFMGRLPIDSFVEFALDRAALLGLGIDVAETSDQAMTLNVSGAAELVDAHEVACSLGPYDCLVLKLRAMTANERPDGS